MKCLARRMFPEEKLSLTVFLLYPVMYPDIDYSIAHKSPDTPLLARLIRRFRRQRSFSRERKQVIEIRRDLDGNDEERSVEQCISHRFAVPFLQLVEINRPDGTEKCSAMMNEEKSYKTLRREWRTISDVPIFELKWSAEWDELGEHRE